MTQTITQKHDLLIGLLKATRKELAIRQEDLSKRLGMHKSFVTKYESGDRRLDLFEVLEICRELSLDIHAIIRNLEGDKFSLPSEDGEYLHGFCKGYLIGKGSTVSEQSAGEDV